ncbi:hypothetical protein C8F01DRAFT_1250026 [Mycena amicta]|nr:hypothetical protein C8F01DRAFT_1250026 [Mycena amicta]
MTTLFECPYSFFNGRGYVVYRTDAASRPCQRELLFDLESGEPQYPMEHYGPPRDAFHEAWEHGGLFSETRKMTRALELDIPLNSFHAARFGHSSKTAPTYVYIGVRERMCRSGPERDAVVKYTDAVHAFLLEKGYDVPCLVVETTTWP